MRIAVDVGNSRIKFGAFALPLDTLGLQAPVRTLVLSATEWDGAALRQWMDGLPEDAQWWIGSVNRAASARLVEALRNDARMLRHSDLPIRINVPIPAQVGIDRLAGAVAVNRLRTASRAAVVIHVGTAITANVVSAQGAFCGGAILPGIEMSAKALEAFTDLLPGLAIERLDEPPPALGDSTLGAIHSGLYWGAVGAMHELTVQLANLLGEAPEVYLTGGAAPSVAALVDPQARYVEHLVLAGIALANEPK